MQGTQSCTWPPILEEGLTVKGASSGMIEIPVAVNFVKAAKNIAQFVKKDEIPYDFNGTARINMFSIPYSTKGSIPVPKLPKISLKDVDVKTLTFKKASLVFNVNLKNDNAFPVNLKGIH